MTKEFHGDLMAMYKVSRLFNSMCEVCGLIFFDLHSPQEQQTAEERKAGKFDPARLEQRGIKAGQFIREIAQMPANNARRTIKDSIVWNPNKSIEPTTITVKVSLMIKYWRQAKDAAEAGMTFEALVAVGEAREKVGFLTGYFDDAPNSKSSVLGKERAAKLHEGKKARREEMVRQYQTDPRFCLMPKDDAASILAEEWNKRHEEFPISEDTVRKFIKCKQPAGR